MKGRIFLLTLLLVSLCAGSNMDSVQIQSNIEPAQIDEIKVLALIDHGFGWNYFTIVETFEAWNINVTTAGTSSTVASCFNREARPVTSDILIEDVDNETLLDFDCVIVPSGGHWGNLIFDRDALNLIAYAHELGLIVSGICTGPIVLSRAGDILNGTKIVGHPNGVVHYRSAGAIQVEGQRVVCDNRVVTGGSGSGPPTGYAGAPTYETCLTIVRELMGVSLITEVNLNPAQVSLESEFQISVELRDLSDVSEGMFDSNISEVLATVYNIRNISLYEEIELEETDGIYIGNFTGLLAGDYSIDIDVENEDRIFTTIRNVTSISIEADVNNQVPMDLILISGIIVIPTIIAIVYIYTKKQG